jgi:hypothetical protein
MFRPVASNLIALATHWSCYWVKDLDSSSWLVATKPLARAKPVETVLLVLSQAALLD